MVLFCVFKFQNVACSDDTGTRGVTIEKETGLESKEGFKVSFLDFLSFVVPLLV